MKLREIAILIRIQQLGTSVTAVIGALTVKGLNLEISNVIILFSIGVLMNICGQVHNDIRDIEIDKCSKELKERPLVKGTISHKLAWSIITISVILVFIITLFFYLNTLVISVLSISIFFGYLYNSFSKKIPGADLFLSVSMALFCLFGAMAVTNNFQGFQDVRSITWIIVAIVFIHVFLMDALGGGLKDAKNDRDAGAKTLAVVLGIKANKTLVTPLSFKVIIFCFEMLTIVFACLPFLLLIINYSYLQILILILLLSGMVFSTLKLLTMKTFDRNNIKFHNRNHELTGYVLVPIILMEQIGITWVIALIILPMLWFMVFNYIFYRDTWTKPRNY